MNSEPLVIAARFDPPKTREQCDAWRDAHAEALAELMPDQVRVDVGRAVGGDFFQVWLPPEVAQRLRRHS